MPLRAGATDGPRAPRFPGQSLLQAEPQGHQIAYVAQDERLLIQNTAQLGGQQGHPSCFAVPGPLAA